MGWNYGQNTEEPKYKCAKCQDKEMYHVSKPDYTGMVWCECHKVREAERLIRRSGLEGEIAEKRFDNFQVTNPFQQELKDKAIAYGKAYFEAKANGQKLPWFYVGGQSGSGKSHICTAICGVMLKRGVPIRYMKWTIDSLKIRALANTPNEYMDELMKYVDCEILYIDDLFKQRSHKKLNASDAETNVLYNIVNERLMRNKSTIISSEWFLKTELTQKLDDATAGRILQSAGGGKYVVSIERNQNYNYRLNGEEDE